METLIITAGLPLNLAISSGSLWKLIDFARRWGALEEKLETHEREIIWLRKRGG